jgi:hypothetical protein
MAKTKGPDVVVHGYLGTGTRVHGYGRNAKGFFPICYGEERGVYYTPGEMNDRFPGTQRPIDCFRCLKTLGQTGKWTGHSRRDELEVQHLIQSTAHPSVAHLRDIPKPACKCGKPATQTLVDSRGQAVGDYCRRCAQEALHKLSVGELNFKRRKKRNEDK